MVHGSWHHGHMRQTLSRVLQGIFRTKKEFFIEVNSYENYGILGFGIMILSEP